MSQCMSWNGARHLSSRKGYDCVFDFVSRQVSQTNLSIGKFINNWGYIVCKRVGGGGVS